ncbi:hypothetical protein [Thalassotalea sp. Y01]|uniref:hypothetical protein n=1 Tax=Thalassotalea sp. Y01 TaxID=2729613 RepID=UPI00145E192C|nr:hypothetical protein [Thalassotalea sp. Y01]NMP14987.1 hypothetical protein [Thalassotalea sp. Y01]
MKVQSRLVDKLSILKEIFPINGVIQVGVSDSITNRYIDWEVDKVFFVEADGKVVGKLKQELKHRNWLFSESVVAQAEQERSFYFANNPKQNGLLKLDPLKKYWRNLKTAHITSVKTVSLQELVCNYDYKANWLSIDCMPAVEVLKGYADKLSELDVITIKAILDAPEDDLLNSTQAEADEFLSAYGFENISVEDDLNPHVGNLIYARNNFSKDSGALVSQDVFDTLEEKYNQLVEENKLLIEAKQELATSLEVFKSDRFEKEQDSRNYLEQISELGNSQQALAEENSQQFKLIDEQKSKISKLLESEQRLQTELQETKATLEVKVKEASQLVDIEKSYLDSQKEINSLNAKTNSLEEKISSQRNHLADIEAESKRNQVLISNYENEISTLKQQLESSQKLSEQMTLQNETLAQMADKQQKLFSSLESNMVARFQTGLLNSVKQIESYIGVQNYLETGNLAMDYHGWPISSDLALFLLNKIERNQYDLIIEFGSGTSTQLFAKALKNQEQNKLGQNVSRLESIDSSKDNLAATYLDLPKKIVTFEHNKKYFDKTMATLTEAGVDELVDLVHAPLVDCRVNGEDFLYYSCEPMLQQLKHVFAGRVAKILVLIDGPPAKTGPLARLPGVPLMLNHLANHQLDIVLDDYNRQEEKDIVTNWKKVFEDRFISYEEEEVICEKGAYFCRINP